MTTTKNSTTNYPRKFKTVKAVDNGFVIEECIMTAKGAEMAYIAQHQQDPKDNLSDEAVMSILAPYDSNQKTNIKDDDYTAIYTHYFRKTI